MHKLLLPIILLLSSLTCRAQIWRDDLKELPEDLKHEIIVFLKFDSVKLDKDRPKGMDKSYFKKWRYHNEQVPQANAELREIAKKYPYQYKIISMKDTAALKRSGAKYMVWLNSFDAFTASATYKNITYVSGRTSSGAYTYGSYAPRVEFGIIDLTSDKRYFISENVSVSETYHYKKYLPKLYRKIEQQLGAKIK